jgi:hypothetical protein
VLALTAALVLVGGPLRSRRPVQAVDTSLITVIRPSEAGLPVFPGAEQWDATRQEGTGGGTVVAMMSARAPLAEVALWYQAALPGATRQHSGRQIVLQRHQAGVYDTVRLAPVGRTTQILFTRRAESP